MDRQWDFLKKSQTTLGVFYPLHYIVAGYPDLEDAHAAASGFRDRGFAAEDVRATTGTFVASQLEAEPENILGQVRQEVVRAFGTEERYIAEDKIHARNGGAFVFVFAPRDEDAENARAVFSEHPPVYARRYLRIAIEEIIEKPDAQTPRM